MSKAVAVVVGVCAHGLAIARSLCRAGIEVVAIEVNRNLPGTKTNSAEIVYVDDINGAGLVDALVALHPKVSNSGRPILFLTNDTMVATIATRFKSIEDLYALSWGKSGAEVIRLLRKEDIEKRCRSVGLRHPKTRVFRDGGEITTAKLDLQYPVIFKPDLPLSAYKTLLVENDEQLDKGRSMISASLPAVAQEYVVGEEEKIRFAALYLIDGHVAARFEGRKLRSRPMGHTSIAISESNDEVHAMALQFFEGLHLSGPVSLEVKEDPDSNYWVIEPTVGRTDFWVGLCINDGVAFPLIEYAMVCSHRTTTDPQKNRTLWTNGERDPLAVIWLALKYPYSVCKKKLVGVFIDRRDIMPWIHWCITNVRTLPQRAAGKVVKILKSVNADQS